MSKSIGREYSGTSSAILGTKYCGRLIEADA